MVKRPLVVLYLVYIYIKILTSLVNITLSQSVRAVWHGVHPTLSVSGPVEYIPGFRCTVILSWSGGLAVRAWDPSVPSSPSVGPLISFCPLVVWVFFLGEGVNHSG